MIPSVQFGLKLRVDNKTIEQVNHFDKLRQSTDGEDLIQKMLAEHNDDADGFTATLTYQEQGTPLVKVDVKLPGDNSQTVELVDKKHGYLGLMGKADAVLTKLRHYSALLKDISSTRQVKRDYAVGSASDDLYTASFL